MSVWTPPRRSAKWRERASRLRKEAEAIAKAAVDRRTPWYAKAVGVATVAYALNPVDLVPDFIPVLGWVDDFLLVGFGIWLSVRLIPKDVLEEHRRAVGL